MTSFYGGPAGSSFSLKEIFRNKAQMEQDLEQRWQSSIGVGDFVFIAYGLPGDEDSAFDANKDIDLKKYKKTYNSTLWQKIYLENVNDQKDELTGIEKFFTPIVIKRDETTGEPIETKPSEYGLGYRLISSMTGNTPKFQVETVWTNPIEYDSEGNEIRPKVQIVYDNQILDAPVLTFYLPKGQTILYQQEEESQRVLNANQDPQVIWNDEDDPEFPKLTIRLPKSQVIEYQGYTTPDVGSPPKVNWDDKTDVNHPTLSFEIPQSQKIHIGTVTPQPAGTQPSATLDQDPDINNLALNLQLPESPEINMAETQIVSPEDPPAVENKGTSNAPLLEFSLPRAVQFEYGTQLGEKTAGSYTMESTTLDKGDYYINAPTGFVYRVTGKTGDTVTLVYQATLQAPLPEVSAGSKDTYKQNESGEWVQNEPDIAESFDDEANQKGWNLQFNMPRFPNVESEEFFIGASEDGSTSVAPVGENLLRFTFNIPRGSRVFAGAEVTRDTLATAVIADAKLGDYYINTDTNNKTSCGDAYELVAGASDLPAANSWVLRGNIRGPIGERLSTVASYEFSNEAGAGIDQVIEADTLEATAPVVETLYGKSLEAYEMIAVNYIYSGDTTSYWYFQVNGVWDRVKITGGMGSVLKNSYIAPTDTSVNSTEVVYTVDYINKLITATPGESEKEVKTYTAKKIDDTVAGVNQKIDDTANTINQEINRITVTWGEISELLTQ